DWSSDVCSSDLSFSLRLETQRAARLVVDLARLWCPRRCLRANQCLDAHSLPHSRSLGALSHVAKVANVAATRPPLAFDCTYVSSRTRACALPLAIPHIPSNT